MRHSFSGPFKFIGVFGVVFLYLGIFGDRNQFDSTKGPAVFAIVGLLMSLALFAVNEIEVIGDQFVIKKGLTFWHKTLQGPASEIGIQVRSGDEGGYVLYVMQQDKVLLQLGTAGSRVSAHESAAKLSQKLGIPQLNMDPTLEKAAQLNS